ncbi:26210_t:CDS:1, partial [Racocetra persica]
PSYFYHNSSAYSLNEKPYIAIVIEPTYETIDPFTAVIVEPNLKS